jgi:hypothetical protein
MRRALVSFTVLLISVLMNQHAPAQVPGNRVTLLVHGALTTASNLYLQPDAQDPGQREASEPFNRLLGAGLELRVPVFGEEFFLSASLGYQSRVDARQRPFAFPDTVRLVPVEEGVRFIPAELGLHALIPFGSETVRMSMGTGVGLYYLGRVVKVAGHEAPVDNWPVDVNIFVTFAVEVRVAPGLSIQSAVKFLDPEARSENRFTDRTISSGGSTGPLPSGIMPSKVAIDGMSLSLGFMVEVR